MMKLFSEILHGKIVSTSDWMKYHRYVVSFINFVISVVYNVRYDTDLVNESKSVLVNFIFEQQHVRYI
jgi:hypothetical protein